MTTTGEPYLPTRLVYKVHKPSALQRALRALPSFVHDKEGDRWVWEYAKESARTLKKLDFPPVYKEMSRDGSVVLAICRFPGPDRMDVYLRCGSRTTKFLEFLDQHVARDVASGEFIDLHNHVVTAANPTTVLGPDRMFPANDQDIPFQDFADMLDAVETGEKASIIHAMTLTGPTNELMPLVRLRLDNCHADGHRHCHLSMQIRDILALVQLKSNTPIRPVEVLRQLLESDEPATIIERLCQEK